MKLRFYLQVTENGTVRATSRYPQAPIPGAALVKIHLELEDEIFKPLEAKGVVAAGAARVIPLVVESQTEAADG